MSASDASPRLAGLLDELRDRCAELERLRRELLARRARGAAVIVGAGVVCALLAIGGVSGETPMLLIVAAAGFGLTALVAWQLCFTGTHRAYVDAFKTRLTGELLRRLAPEMNYDPSRGLPEDLFRGAGLHSGSVDRYHSEDLFHGRVGATELWFSEVHAEERRTRRDSKGHSQSYYATIFRGLLVIADFHKDFRSDVVVMPDFAESTFGSLGRWFQGLSSGLRRMENPEFEKAFVVRAADPVEAHYILTPDIQERLLALRNRTDPDLRAAFRDSRVILAIPDKEDRFEPDLHRPADNPRQFARILSEIDFCLGLVDALDLNTRIWTKE